MHSNGRMLKIFGYILLAVLSANFLVMAFDRNISVFGAFAGSALITSPLIINYLLLLPFKNINNDILKILFWGIAGAYIANVLIATYFMYTLASSVISEGTTGEGGGYWFLFTAAGAFKLSGVGVVVGVILSSIYFLFRQTANKRVN